MKGERNIIVHCGILDARCYFEPRGMCGLCAEATDKTVDTLEADSQAGDKIIYTKGRRKTLKGVRIEADGTLESISIREGRVKTRTDLHIPTRVRNITEETMDRVREKVEGIFGYKADPT